jgi:hypothetical protein
MPGRHLARSRAWHIRALSALLAPGNRHAGPFPVRAAAAPAQDINIRRAAGHRPCNITKCKASDWNPSCWRASRRPVLVVLLNDYAIGRDARHLDVGVCDA